MKLSERLQQILGGKYGTAVVLALGAAGLLLLLLSSLMPDTGKAESTVSVTDAVSADAASYCSDTEKRLSEFLGRIDGAGEVEVYLTVGSGEKRVYASDVRENRSGDRREVEEKYVMINGSGSRTGLLERVEAPEITGAVVICTGGDSPRVQEKIYCAVEAALGLSPGKVYVAKMK